MTLCPELGPRCPYCGLPDPKNNPYCFCRLVNDVYIGPSIAEMEKQIQRDREALDQKLKEEVDAAAKPAEERIVAAAINVGITISLPPPARHHTILRAFSQWSDYTVQPHEQGFLTDRGRYVGREEAKDIAYRSGQYRGNSHPTQLFSEDLW